MHWFILLRVSLVVNILIPKERIYHVPMVSGRTYLVISEGFTITCTIAMMTKLKLQKLKLKLTVGSAPFIYQMLTKLHQTK